MGFVNNAKLIVGYDLGNEYSQISYALSETGVAETISQIAGEQKYNIPTVLCKRHGKNQWFYGREALRAADRQEGILVENLLGMAMDGEPVVVEGESYDPAALLALFFKRSLGQLSQTGGKLSSLMVTCPVIDRKILKVLVKMVESSLIKADRISFQGYAESFYGYMLRQPKELWTHPAILFQYSRDMIRIYRMEYNRRTTPIVVIVEENEYAFPQPSDEALLEIAEEACGKSIIGSVFLIGDGFQGDWMKEALRFLCRGRRVFQGNNLFSKGACCGMQEKTTPGELSRTHVFLGNDKLKANIGMQVLRGGKESYFALLDAGMNWYEAERTLEVYIQDGNELLLKLVPLIRRNSPKAGAASDRDGIVMRIVLEGLVEGTARLKLHFYLKSEHCLVVEAEDLGFGEFRAASGRTWKDEIEIYQEADGWG